MRWNLLQELPMRTILPHPLPCVCCLVCPGCECAALSDSMWNPKDTPVTMKLARSEQALSHRCILERRRSSGQKGAPVWTSSAGCGRGRSLADGEIEGLGYIEHHRLAFDGEDSFHGILLSLWLGRVDQVEYAALGALHMGRAGAPQHRFVACFERLQDGVVFGLGVGPGG